MKVYILHSWLPTSETAYEVHQLKRKIKIGKMAKWQIDYKEKNVPVYCLSHVEQDTFLVSSGSLYHWLKNNKLSKGVTRIDRQPFIYSVFWCQKYVVTFNSDGLYIFTEGETQAAMFDFDVMHRNWKNSREVLNEAVKIAGGTIYVFTEERSLRCLSLDDLVYYREAQREVNNKFRWVAEGVGAFAVNPSVDQEVYCLKLDGKFYHIFKEDPLFELKAPESFVIQDVEAFVMLGDFFVLGLTNTNKNSINNHIQVLSSKTGQKVAQFDQKLPANLENSLQSIKTIEKAKIRLIVSQRTSGTFDFIALATKRLVLIKGNVALTSKLGLLKKNKFENFGMLVVKKEKKFELIAFGMLFIESCNIVIS